MGTTAISITAILVSGIVGPGLAAWWTRERQRADHRQELSRELRQVLDDSASALGNTKRAFEWLWVLHQRETPREDEDAQRSFARWRHEIAAVRLCEDRLAIRLGPGHPVHEAYCRCMRNLDDHRPFAWAYERGLRIDVDRQEKIHVAYRDTRRAFVAAAKDLVGPIT